MFLCMRVGNLFFIYIYIHFLSHVAGVMRGEITVNCKIDKSKSSREVQLLPVLKGKHMISKGSAVIYELPMHYPYRIYM